LGLNVFAGLISGAILVKIALWRICAMDFGGI
jgi:hypothetical protein